jgi:NADH dehydrogenase
MKILIFGGRGFVGSHLSKKLSKNHKVITSDPNEGKKNHRKADITKQKRVEKISSDCDLVINLAGLSPLSEPVKTSYEKVHVGGAESLANLDTTVFQMSALGADSSSDISYLKTKGKAEEIIKKSLENYKIFRPSLIFGEGSELFEIINLAEKFRSFPFINTKVQPIVIDDLMEIFSLAVEGKIGKDFISLGGPQQMSIFDMVEKKFKADRYYCFPIPFAKTGAKIISFFDRLNLTGITNDQVKFLQQDNVLKNNDAAKFIELTTIEDYLKN